MKTKNIYIYGAGPSGLEILELIKIINYKAKAKLWNIKGFIDTDKKLIGKKIKSINVFNQSKINKNNSDFAICSITNPKLKNKVLNNIKKKFKLANLIHPNIEIPDDLVLGNGNVIFSNVHLSFKLKIKDNCFIGYGCDIGHDTKIGNSCSIMPGTIINGNVNIGDNCLIGSSALLSVGVKIGKNCKIGSGTNIFNNIKSNLNVFEVPRLMKQKN